MNYFAFSALVNGLSSIILGIFVLIKGPERLLNRTYAFFAFCVFLWSFGYFFWQLLTTPDLALFWTRFLMAGAILIPVAYFDFSLAITNRYIQKQKERIIAHLLGLIFFSFNFTPLIVSGTVKKLFFDFWPTPGILYPFFLIMFFYYVIYSLWLMYQTYKVQVGHLKEQIKYVFMGTAIGFICGSTNYFLWYDIPIPPYLNIFVSVYVGMIAYAIIKHRLLDIEVVIKRTAVYSVLTALLTGLFVSLILISNQLFSSYTGYNSLWPSIIGAFVVAFLFQPLRDTLQKIVDNLFFRTRYDYQRILKKYSYALTQPMLDFDRFAHLAPFLLTRAMKLSGASFMVLSRLENCYQIRAGVGNAETLKGLTLPDTSPLIEKLKKEKREISREEETNPEIIKTLDELKCSLIIPSISWSEYFKEPTLLCTTNLGEKLSGESFSKEDIDFLKTLANQAAISIEYAFIFEELLKKQEQIIRSEKMCALGSITAGVAHELKNPLTYLSTVAQVLRIKWDDPSFRESVMQMLPAEVERMRLITEGILDFSRTRELSPQPTEISDIIKKTLALLGHEIKKNKIYVREEYHHQTKVLGDPNRLTQVFMNLISNAIQAIGEKGGDLTIVSQSRENEVVISVTDTGPGIPQENLSKIFDPFFTTKETGTGLGLAITKKIVEEHKGTISVISTVGRGTSFLISLPKATG